MQEGIFGPHPHPESGLSRDGGEWLGAKRDGASTLPLDLKGLIETQKALSDAHEAIQLDRSKLRSCGNAVRIQRTSTGDAEVQFMNAVRGFVNKHGKDFASPLMAAYDEVIEERDKLGTMEDEYLQTERTLSGKDWTFMEKARVFYQYDLQEVLAAKGLDSRPDDQLGYNPAVTQPLLPPPPLGNNMVIVRGAPPPPPPPRSNSNVLGLHDARPPPPPNAFFPIDQQYQMALSKLDDFRKDFNSLRIEQSQQLDDVSHNKRHPLGDLDSSTLYDRYSTLLDQITHHEVRVQKLKQESMEQANRTMLLDRRMSDPIQSGKRAASPLETLTRSQSVGVLCTGFESPSMKLRIRDWLLHNLKNSVIDRTVYQNVLEEFGIPVVDRDTLVDCAERTWPLGTTSPSQELDDYPLTKILDEEELSSTQRSLAPEEVAPAKSKASYTSGIGPSLSGNTTHPGSLNVTTDALAHKIPIAGVESDEANAGANNAKNQELDPSNQDTDRPESRGDTKSNSGTTTLPNILGDDNHRRILSDFDEYRVPALMQEPTDTSRIGNEPIVDQYREKENTDPVSKGPSERAEPSCPVPDCLAARENGLWGVCSPRSPSFPRMFPARMQRPVSVGNSEYLEQRAGFQRHDLSSFHGRSKSTSYKNRPPVGFNQNSVA